MINDLLRARIKTCSAGGKFVLIRFVQLYGTGMAVALSVKALAKDLGVTDRVASDAIQQLVAQGLLSQQATDGRLGRPSSSYTCISKALAGKLSLGGGAKQKAMHVQCIDRLLNGVLSQGAERLLYANRLLLGVLLAHADEFGVVRGLGLRDLSELTGLKKEVLRQRLVTLESQCYIRATVPGVTGRALFKPTKSLYILNLGHQMLKVQAEPYPLVLMHAPKVWPARNIFFAAMRNKIGPLELGHGSYIVDGLFDATDWMRLTPMLQAMIDGYASFVLSEHFDALEQDFPIIDELYERIRQDFAHLGSKYVGSDSEPGNPGDLVLLLYEEAVTWARQIKAVIKKTTNLCGGKFKCIVLPPSKQVRGYTEYWALLVIPAEAEMLRGFDVNMWLKSLNRTYEQEDDIPLEDRYRSGLLTRPRGASKVSN